MKEPNSPLAKPQDVFTLPSSTNTGAIMVLPRWFKGAKPKRAVVPDYSNQLDLFSEAPDDTPAPVENTAHTTGTIHAKPRPPQQLDFGTLEPLPPFDAGPVEARGTSGARVGEDGAAVRGPALRADIGKEDGIPPGLGDGGGPVPHSRRAVPDEPEDKPPSRDFRITDAHGIGQGSLHAKARDNIAAIRLLKALEAENRDATDPEKAILARYVGWGAISAPFDRWQPEEWRSTARDLKELLTDDEFESARASTPNAHFTSPMVIKAIWDGLERLGVGKGAEILEPAMGVGHFFGLMPESMQGGHRTGIELDSITARIAKKLYPDSTIFAKGFEETPLPVNYFDAVVGNVPFGDYPVHDPLMKHQLTRAIHDYFFAKSLQKVRPGGVTALITSRYTMDKENDTVRRHLAEQADLLGAIRLPNTAFKGNAGTEVTTDILFLRKRRLGEEPAGEKWLGLETLDSREGPMHINEYFARHPEMMLGTMKLQGTMYRGAEPTLEGELTPALLKRAIAALPEGAYIPKDEQRGPPPKILDAEEFTGVKDGAYADRGGKLVIRSGRTFEPATLSSAAEARIRGLMAIRDAVRNVFQTQLDDAPEPVIVEERKDLNRRYDAFVRRFGPISSKENIRAFAGDPDQPLLLSLENYDAEHNRATKTAIFERRTLERYEPKAHVDTAAEALAISLNETGGIDWTRMASLTGHTPKQMQAELDAMVYRNPEGDWETADRYLSGNVRAKLATAEAAASIDPAYRRNVDALKAVQPADLLPGDISARLGSSWIPASDVRDFIAETLDVPKSLISVCHSGAIATWALTLDTAAKSSVANTTTWGTGRAFASELIEDALNGRTPTIYDQVDKDTRVVNQRETLAAREAQQKLKDRFSEWVWKDEDRAHRLARYYNNTFNNLRLRTYDGSHLTFPGMNRSMLRHNDLDKHQKDAVWRILQNDNTLLAHVVGAGKTAVMTAAAMEMKRLGLAQKPMIVVPNHLVEQWGAAFLALYPNAHIFVAGKDAFAAGNRQKAMSRIATGNYDAVIVSHKSFELLPVSDETFRHFVDQQKVQLEDAIREAKAEKGDKRRIVKELEKAKKRLEAKLKERADRERKDDAVTFEQLGIDRLMVDEADLFKNLGFVSKMNRIAGLANTESNRALDMYMKTRYLAERGGGTVFATGTPVSNTMAEMYTLQRYLAPQLLAAAGVEHFDAWAANFGEAVTALELAPDGSGYRMHTRFAKFVNLPELLSMFRTFADVQTADMLNLPRPRLSGGKPHIVSAPASDELKQYVQSLVRRAQKLRSGGVDPRSDNMLKITGDGRKAALDRRLVDPFAEVFKDTKVTRAIDNIYRAWDHGRDRRTTQLVFCDLSTPSADKFNVYDEIRDKLIELGVPAKEIAYIHDADTDTKKKALFDSVNAGRIRILLGSTEKMGAGTNVQKRLKAEHHLDAPWRPRDIDQREGRILRQGNDNEEVDIYRYATEGSFDAYMWQTLENKARFIAQVMNGSVTVRQAEDLESGALTFAEIKAIASGNPAVMEKVKVDTEIRKLDQLKASHVNQQHNIRWQVRSLPEHIEKAQNYHEALTADIGMRDTHAEEEFAMKVGNREFSGKGAREEAGNALNNAVMSWRDDMTLKVRGHYKGFEILSRGNRFTDEPPELFVRGKATYKANLNPDNPLGTIASIDHTLRNLDAKAEAAKRDIQQEEKALADYTVQMGRAFEHEQRLKELMVKQAELNAALDLDKHEAQVVADAPEADPELTRSGFA
ncbi:MAG TPA: DEAD/DEAH box helicase family protein, partial [Xanthobacteraceae bacterium]|nr:DEAD/DEAH box helicase family protein [Xanthobacteraceae bacterium]